MHLLILIFTYLYIYIFIYFSINEPYATLQEGIRGRGRLEQPPSFRSTYLFFLIFTQAHSLALQVGNIRLVSGGSGCFPAFLCRIAHCGLEGCKRPQRYVASVSGQLDYPAIKKKKNLCRLKLYEMKI